MIINTDGVSRGSEHLDLALKDLQIIVNKLTNAKSISPVSCPYFDTVISQASGFRSNCESTLNDCNTFIENVTKDDLSPIVSVLDKVNMNKLEQSIEINKDKDIVDIVFILGSNSGIKLTVGICTGTALSELYVR